MPNGIIAHVSVSFRIVHAVLHLLRLLGYIQPVCVLPLCVAAVVVAEGVSASGSTKKAEEGPACCLRWGNKRRRLVSEVWRLVRGVQLRHNGWKM